GMTIALPTSKTDQEGSGDVVNIPRIRSQPDLCPVVALRRWINLADITEGPVFRQISKHGSPTRRGLSPASVGVLLKEALVRAGLEDHVNDFGAHSLRAGVCDQRRRGGRS
ncbi:MAG: integrase, partial [Anaerolineae bacterium]|nr:integrase [Anaerolineae bacterium]